MDSKRQLQRRRAPSEISLVKFLDQETRQQRALVEEFEIVQNRAELGWEVLSELYNDTLFRDALGAAGIDGVSRFLAQPPLAVMSDAQQIASSTGPQYVRGTFRNKCSIYRQRIGNFRFAKQSEILNLAIAQGFSREELSRQTNLPLKSINRLADLLVGISPLAAEILGAASGSICAYDVLRRMSTSRQFEVAEFMVRRNDYSTHFCGALLAATKAADLVIPFRKTIPIETCLRPQKLEGELRNLQMRLEQSQSWHGNNSIRLVVIQAHFRWLLSNGAIAEWLATYRPASVESIVAFAQTTRGQLELARH